MSALSICLTVDVKLFVFKKRPQVHSGEGTTNCYVTMILSMLKNKHSQLHIMLICNLNMYVCLSSNVALRSKNTDWTEAVVAGNM